MIGFRLEQFANSQANLEHVTLYFDNLVDKNETLSIIFHGIFYSIVNTCTSKWTRNGKVKLKLVRPEKKNKGSMTRRRVRNAKPGLDSLY